MKGLDIDEGFGSQDELVVWIGTFRQYASQKREQNFPTSLAVPRSSEIKSVDDNCEPNSVSYLKCDYVKTYF